MKFQDKNPELFKKIKQLLEQGWSQEEVGKKYNLSQTYIGRIKKYYNILVPKKQIKNNLVNKTIGHWLIQSISTKTFCGKKDKQHRLYYNCKCLKCGIHKHVLAQNLKNKRSQQCQSCRKVEMFKGIEELSGTYLIFLQHSAKKRNLEFNLTKEYLWKIYIQQNRKCALSGINIEFCTKHFSQPKYFTAHQTASLDRIDSTKGYIEGNVQWVHKNVNQMKWNYNQIDFIKICGQIYNYNQLKNIEYFI